MGKTFNQDDVKVIKESKPLQLSGDRAIIVKRIKFKGDKEYIDVRQYYMDDSGRYKPTQKGLWIPIEDEDNKEFSITVAKYILDFNNMTLNKLTESSFKDDSEEYNREESEIEEG
jgi:hypothetical protein